MTSTNNSNNNNNNNNNNADDLSWDPNEVPRDATIISLILQSMGLSDDEFEPRVVNQLMEFIYTAEVLQDGQSYMEHAGKPSMDLSDVRLAIQSRVNYSFTQPPPRELLLSLAQSKNAMVLPQMPSKFGVHLPPDEYCLVSANYQVDPKQEKAAEETTTSSKSTTDHALNKDNFTPPPPPTRKAAQVIPIHLNSA